MSEGAMSPATNSRVYETLSPDDRRLYDQLVQEIPSEHGPLFNSVFLLWRHHANNMSMIADDTNIRLENIEKVEKRLESDRAKLTKVIDAQAEDRRDIKSLQADMAMIQRLVHSLLDLANILAAQMTRPPDAGRTAPTSASMSTDDLGYDSPVGDDAGRFHP